jgi:hypothetical protein
MAAFVLANPAEADAESRTGVQLGIFPGSATPTVFPAGAPFWIGYGFARDPDAASGDADLADDTRFELELDGERVSMHTDLHSEAERAVRKTHIAEFPAGLPAGWHDFTGRWYDAGRLVLSSRNAIQFVEP